MHDELCREKIQSEITDNLISDEKEMDEEYTDEEEIMESTLTLEEKLEALEKLE